MVKLFIGTSGFSYSHWEDGVFYPKNLSRTRHLQYYASQFNTVELNSPFYHLPNAKTFQGWRKRTPENFVFAVKVSRFITHVKKLKDCKKEWEEFLKRASFLEEKLGPFLFQFPASWHKNLPRLKDFVGMLRKTSKDFRFAFEFRHKSWFSDDVYKFFEEQKNLSFCITDSPYWPSVEKVFGEFAYFRMHGGRSLYSSKYSQKELKELAHKIKKCLRQELDVYCYFNNDAHGYACENAKELQKLCQRN
ncbi:MAG TPA: DUF72 domain-containing protein [bacterium]|nr:DUF72 domain-containing protein [bacterium]